METTVAPVDLAKMDAQFKWVKKRLADTGRRRALNKEAGVEEDCQRGVYLGSDGRYRYRKDLLHVVLEEDCDMVISEAPYKGCNVHMALAFREAMQSPMDSEGERQDMSPHWQCGQLWCLAVNEPRDFRAEFFSGMWRAEKEAAYRTTTECLEYIAQLKDALEAELPAGQMEVLLRFRRRLVQASTICNRSVRDEAARLRAVDRQAEGKRPRKNGYGSRPLSALTGTEGPSSSLTVRHNSFLGDCKEHNMLRAKPVGPRTTGSMIRQNIDSPLRAIAPLSRGWAIMEKVRISETEEGGVTSVAEVERRLSSEGIRPTDVRDGRARVPKGFMGTLVHRKIIPTLLSSPTAHPVCGGRHTRYMQSSELLSGMGIRPSDSRWAEAMLCPPGALQAHLGVSAHCGLTQDTIAWGIAHTNREWPKSIRFSTGYTGWIDVYDISMRRLCRSPVYVAGAEIRDVVRRDLALRHPKTTWHKDANSEEASRAMLGVHFHGFGFCCQPNSDMGKLSNLNSQQRADNARENVENALRGLSILRSEVSGGLESRPWVVHIENVKGMKQGCIRPVFDYFNTQLRMLPYEWRFQLVCPTTHAKIPWRRSRFMWVGVRKDLWKA